MKYLIAIVAIVICCSFKILQKMTRENDHKWIMFIFPNSTDTNTFVQLTYSINSAYKEMRTKDTGWMHMPETIAISEEMKVNGQDKYSSYYRKDDTDYREYSSISLSRDYNEYGSLNHPSYRIVQLNDSLKVGLHYFENGTISRCEVKNKWREEKFEAIEWDSTYNYRWQGVFETVIKDDTIAVMSQTDEYQKIVRYESYRKVGVWKKYDNFTGAFLDSKTYK